jgi:hypothetical protein
MRSNRPHIPSIPYISKSKDTNKQLHPNLGVSAFVHPEFHAQSFNHSLRLVPHRCVSSSSVRRYLGPPNKRRKRKNDGFANYFEKSGFFVKTKAWVAKSGGWVA